MSIFGPVHELMFNIVSDVLEYFTMIIYFYAADKLNLAHIPPSSANKYSIANLFW